MPISAGVTCRIRLWSSTVIKFFMMNQITCNIQVSRHQYKANSCIVQQNPFHNPQQSDLGTARGILKGNKSIRRKFFIHASEKNVFILMIVASKSNQKKKTEKKLWNVPTVTKFLECSSRWLYKSCQSLEIYLICIRIQLSTPGLKSR